MAEQLGEVAPEGLLVCRRCNVRYACAADYLETLAEVERLREALTWIANAEKHSPERQRAQEALDG